LKGRKGRALKSRLKGRLHLPVEKNQNSCNPLGNNIESRTDIKIYNIKIIVQFFQDLKMDQHYKATSMQLFNNITNITSFKAIPNISS